MVRSVFGPPAIGREYSLANDGSGPINRRRRRNGGDLRDTGHSTDSRSMTAMADKYEWRISERPSKEAMAASRSISCTLGIRFAMP